MALPAGSNPGFQWIEAQPVGGPGGTITPQARPARKTHENHARPFVNLILLLISILLFGVRR